MPGTLLGTGNIVVSNRDKVPPFMEYTVLHQSDNTKKLMHEKVPSMLPVT